MLTIAFAPSRRARRRGFTLVELLVVVGIISILAGLLLPAIMRAMGTAELTSCVNQLRQIGQAFTNYYKDFDSWLVSAGNRTVVSGSNLNVMRGPFREPPLDYKQAVEVCKQTQFPFWYAALAPYVNPVATFYSCPSKKQAVIGYGYNYAAPFGESILYPFDQTKYGYDYPATHCSGAKFNKAANKDLAQDEFCWPWGAGPDGFMPYSCYRLGQPAGVPILWYGQSAHFSAITDPSGQIVVCDTGLITNDPQWEWDSTSGIWLPTENYAPPEDWREHTAGFAAECWMGYTRFPLSEIYTGATRKWSDIFWPPAGVIKRVGFYKYFYCSYTYDPNGNDAVYNNLSWRPMPRHNKRVASLFFDGRAMPVPITDIVNYKWGDRKCLFDNKPPTKPPSPRADCPSALNGGSVGGIPQSAWLPIRKAGGYIDPNQ